jgi:hypothetical protein
VTLLGFDFQGRSELQRFLSGRPRLEQRQPGISWLTLPAGQGALYRFSRVEAVGGTTFGLLLVDPAGDARSIFELPGTGPTGDEESFSSRGAVDPAGAALLVATTPDAGGDLYEVDVQTGAALLRTAGFGPLDFGTAGLALAPDWGVAACADRVLRFDRTGPTEAEQVSFGSITPPWYAGEVALSPTGLQAVTVAGLDSTLAHVFVFGPTGGMRRATKQAMRVSSAGFQPEWSHGPYLAVSDDGSRAAWRATVNQAGEDKHEAFMAAVPQPAMPPGTASHLSSDSNYLDTLDEIGEFLFKPFGTTLTLAVGEMEVGETMIAGLDIYEATEPTAGTEDLVNITLTNGIATPPFFAKSELDPENGLFMLDDGSVVLHDSDSGGGGQFLRTIPGQTGIQTVIGNVKELDGIEAVGDHVFAVIQRDQGSDDREVWVIPPIGAGAPSLVMSMPEIEHVLHTAVHGDGYVGFVRTESGKQRLWLLNVHDLSTRKLRRFLYGPTLGFAPSGELVFSVGAAGTLAIQAALPVLGPPFRLKVPVAPGFIMPGAAQ